MTAPTVPATTDPGSDAAGATRTVTLGAGAAAPPAAPAGLPVVPGYEVLGELGRGGMGVVYLARQHGLNRPVALKMISPSADPRHQVRFLSEAETAAAVCHPGLVLVYDFGENAGRPFLAMEFCPGGSLADKLRAGGPLPPRDAADLVARVAAAVQGLHEQGVVHRDLKPANVLFDEAGAPKVADFGLAKRGPGADLTRTGAVMGTPAYMAPEQARGGTKLVGPGADIYALGVVLFECLAGRRPFEADDPVALVLKVAEDEAPALRAVAPDAPRCLEQVCRRCLAKDPHARYPTAAALADDLARFLAGEPVAGSRQTMYERLWANLDHARHDADLAAYGAVFFWLAGVMVVTEGVVTLGVRGYLPALVIPSAHWARVVVLAGLVGWYRRGSVLPATAGERCVWSVWVGYLITCLANAVCHRMSGLGWQLEADILFYQTHALLAGLAFFALGPLLWGWCYTFGGVFVGLALVMALDLRWAPLEFGLTWAGVLVVIGLRLRRLARVAA